MSISRGEWYKRIPRDPIENLRFRKRILELCRHNKEYQRAVWHLCKHDLIAFINLFVYQYNPLVKGEATVGPFITWEFQDTVLLMEPPVGKGILWCYENDRTAVIEKSRDMGASWLFLIFEVWLCLFHEHIQALNISRSKDAVDSASRNSLFAKIRFIHKHLPDWLKGPVVEQKLYFEYGRSGSEITGEASTGKAGTGGRGSVVFIDEFSQIEEDIAVRQNTASISDCRFFNGTHLGTGTEFFNLTKSAEIVQIQMHWTRHPRKNDYLYSFDTEERKVRYWRYDSVRDCFEETKYPIKPFPEDYPFDQSGHPSGGPHPGLRSIWYDKKAAEIGTSRQVAMELDINAEGSASQFYDGPVISKLMSQCKDPYWVGSLDFDMDTAQPIQFIPEENGHLKLWVEPTAPNSTGKLNTVPHGEYIIAGDIGYGNGATPSCFTVFDAKKGLKVGAYANSWKDPKQMAPFIVALARTFKNKMNEPALLIWETPGPGYIFGQEVLEEFGYKKVFWNIVDSFAGERKVSDKPGWYANSKNKFEAHNQYHIALKTGEFVNWDKHSLKETLSYVHYKGSIEHPKAQKNDDASAEGSNHGDRVVADMLAWLVAKRMAARLVEDLPKEPPILPNSIAGRRILNARRARESADIWSRN